MNPFIPFSIVASVFMIIAFFVTHYSREEVVKRKLKKAVDKKISNFVSGDIAKIVGKVEIVGSPLIAPLSGRSCGYYYIYIEQRVSSGKGTHWQKFLEEEKAGTFVVRDGRYCAYINTDMVKSYLVQDRVYNTGFFEDSFGNFEKYLSDHGKSSEGFLGGRTLRYREGVLQEGELIAAIGRGEWKTAGQLNLEGDFDRVLVINPTEIDPVYLSDDPSTVKATYNSF